MLQPVSPVRPHALLLRLMRVLMLVWLLPVASAWAAAEVATVSAQSVDLLAPAHAGRDWIWLGGAARAAPAEGGAAVASPDAVLHDPALTWQRGDDPIMYFGFSQAVWWVHVRLHNPGNTPLTRVLEIAEPIYDDLHVWVLDGSTTIVEARMGDRIAFDERPIAFRHPSVGIEVPPNTTVEVVIRAHAVDGEHDPLPLRLWEADAFFAAMQVDALIYGAYYGAVLILLLYNLLVFLSTRERSFFWYAVYLASFLAWNLSFRGFAFQYLWPHAPHWNSVLIVLFVVCLLLSLCQFTWTLLDLRRQTPWLYRASVALAIAAALHLVAIVLDPDVGAFATLDPLGMVLGTVLMLAALRIALRGNVTARIYVLAVGCLYLFGALPYYFVALGALSANLLTLHAINIGSALEFLLLALALAHRINSLKREKHDAERMAFDTLRGAAQTLEAQVEARTAELERANRALRELAVRDGLTGLYNRRHFNEALRQELARAQRLGKPLGLLLLDVDHFKQLNDLAGHQTGDDVLVRLGALLADFARRSTDVAFRVGGEEFAVLCLDVDTASLRDWAERLRYRLEASAWSHPAPGVAHVTASIGLACSSPGDTPEALFARADRALYRAKQGGRNRVVMDEEGAAAGSEVAAVPAVAGRD
ncbi:MAG: diguanylate cyclase [Rhodocyclaceae bacterium]